MTTDSTAQLLGRGVGQFLDDVASAAPAPGGGVVAAVTAAAAAGLVAMAARLSPHLDGASDVIDRAEQLRARAGELASRDGEVYGAVLAATDHADKREALVAATELPLELADLAAEVAALAERVARQGNPNLEGDAGTGLLLAAAAARSAACLVELNSRAGGLGPERADLARARCDDAAARVERWKGSSSSRT